MEEVKKDPEINQRPKWLKKLQLYSWEPEILLSGIVLYGMFQVPEILDKILAFGEVNFKFGQKIGFEELIIFLNLAIDWLIIGLILHLISRGIWVGMIGLSFTFPSGINHENLKYSPKFSDYISRIPSIESVIVSLEKVCSSLFAISFMLFMCIVGGYLYVFIIFLLPVVLVVFIFFNGDFTQLSNTLMQPFAITILLLSLVALADFLTLGLIKRIKWLSRVYYPFYRVVSALTLSFLYRQIYYSIVSNFSKWRISLFLFVFVSITVFMVGEKDNVYPGETFSGIDMWSSISQVGAFSGYYDDQNNEKYSQRAHIQSDVIRGNTVRLFVVARADLEDSIRKVCNYDSLTTALDTAKMYIDLHCVSSFFQVRLDDSLIQDLPWKFHYKTTTNQKGMLTWINIRKLPEGLHQLTLKGNDAGGFTYARIPFFREYTNDMFLPEVPKKNKEDPGYLELKPILPK